MTDPSEDLVEAAQPNPLLRRVDALCGSRDWDGLIELARRCREAVERGKQLWPIAEHIDYRLALEAPASYAAAVLTPNAGRFALGPLTEVAASTHTFGELSPHLGSPLVAGVVAAERVIRGEDLTGVAGAHQEILELPMALMPWEPAYVLPVYRSDDMQAPSVEVPAPGRRTRPPAADHLDDPELTRVMLDLVSTWVDSSNGTADVAVTEGPVESAVGALADGEFLIGEVDSRAALQLMAWAAAGGGAHGRRRGAAMGRSAAWWVAATLGELEWPPDPAQLEDRLEELRWFVWNPLRPMGGWSLHLGVEDREAGWSAAIAAEDRA